MKLTIVQLQTVKMWSITLVVVVSVMSSMVMLVIGVSLAIVIERHRHRNILRQHGVDLRTARTHKARHIITSQPPMTPRSQRSVRNDVRLSDISESWAVSASQEKLVDMAALQEITEPAPAQVKPIGKSIRQLSQKSQRRRRLRKGTLSTILINSPLSAITESTDSPHSSPKVFDLSAKEDCCQKILEEKVKEPVPWPLTIARTRNHGDKDVGSMSESDTTSKMVSRSQSSILLRSRSMSNPCPRAPNGPLPPLPMREVQEWKRLHLHQQSTDSIETINSSVLASSSASTIEVSTQDWSDFDFGLNPATVKSKPGARRAHEGFSDQRSEVVSFRNSSDTREDIAASTISCLHPPKPIVRRSASCGSRPNIRHSMFETIHYRHLSALPDQQKDSKHSAEPTVLPRAISLTNGEPVCWDTRPSAPSKRNTISGDSYKKGHQRQNCVRISGIPVLQPRRSRHSMMLLAEDGTRQTVWSNTREVADKSPWPKPLAIKRSSDVSRPDSEIFDHDRPNTPGSRLSPHWELDEANENDEGSSVRAFDSPVLPSPAYTSAGLVPRQSQVRGPRSPPSRIPRKSDFHDLRMSVMMLRSTNMEGTLSDRYQERQRRITGLSGNAAISVRGNSELQATASNSPALRPGSSLHQNDIATSQSSVSIWEDISVVDDSPGSKIPTPTKRTAVSDGSSRFSTPNKNLFTQEELRNFIENYRDGRQRSNAKEIGLGLNLGTISEASRSLYDDDGFLKE